MLDYLVFMGIAYGVACLISGLKPNLPLAIFGGLIGLLIGWAGGLTLQLGVPYWLFGIDAKEAVMDLMGRGFWMALLGAWMGAAQGRKGQGAVEGKAWSLFGARSWKGALLGVLVVVVASNVLIGIIRFSNKPQAYDSKGADPVASQAESPYVAPAPTQMPASPPPAAPATSSTPGSDSAALDAHYRKIYAAHPDADSVVSHPAFNYWVAEATERKRIVDEGTADEVITLLSQYKSYQRQLQADSQRKPVQQNVQQAANYPSPDLILGGGNSRGCEYKAVMTNENYAACGISPPSKN